MSSLSEIVRALQEIRDFLKNKMTPELMHSLQTALNNINTLLADPNLDT